MEKTNTGCVLGQARSFFDNRGWFNEIWKQSRFPLEIKQINLSFSYGGVVRGLHFQTPPQGKYIRVISGQVTDCVIDLRSDSSTFGKMEVFELGSKDYLYVPPCFAHGFWARKDTHFLYACTEVYNPDGDGGINPLDKDFDFPWRGYSPLISDKDLKLPSFSEWLENFKGWNL